jgi:hypothetical protein
VVAQDEQLRQQLVSALGGGHAHITMDDTLDGFPVHLAGVRPGGMPHSAWELLEHIRIAQKDILDFSSSADHPKLKWPGEYWPAEPQPQSDTQWHKSVSLLRSDLAAFEHLVQDTNRDLFQPFPWGDGQTLLREALLIIDHNSYHLGQLLLVRRALENS